MTNSFDHCLCSIGVSMLGVSVTASQTDINTVAVWPLLLTLVRSGRSRSIITTGNIGA